MSKETGKQRSQRIEIDYYRKPTDLTRLRKICIWAGLILAGVYAVYVLASGDPRQTSTGPVAMVHASFENDCEQCHQAFTPIGAQGVSLDWSLIGLDSEASISHLEDACQKCHQVGGHYRDKMESDWQLSDMNCAGCHTDHAGRDRDLTQISQQKCIACHNDLAEGCLADPTVHASVTAFTKETHGDFAALQVDDPGTVKFDHRQHLMPGQVEAGTKGAFTLEMLDRAFRERYRRDGQNDSSPVQLDCTSCHEPAGNPDTTQGLLSDRELGRYLKPISFEQHCSACHAMNPGMATSDTFAIPHAIPWSKTELLLRATVTGTRASGQARNPRDNSRQTPQVGEGIGNAAQVNASEQEVSQLVSRMKERVREQCRKCHDESAIADDPAIADAVAKPGSLIPRRWLKHGLFDHGAHRRMDCRHCHAAAYGVNDQGPEANDHQVVMIAGIESCTDCHRPTDVPEPNFPKTVGTMPTWASDNCTLCHRYHTPVAEPSQRSVSELEIAGGPHGSDRSRPADGVVVAEANP